MFTDVGGKLMEHSQRRRPTRIIDQLLDASPYGLIPNVVKQLVAFGTLEELCIPDSRRRTDNVNEPFVEV